MAKVRTPIESLLLKFEIDVESGCWVWTASRRDGYGAMRIGGRNYRAHRVAYEHFVGEIPDGLILDHLCRNRACVNPDHLEPVTYHVNLHRSELTNAGKTHCVWGHPYDAENTRFDSKGRRRCRTCARESDRRRERAA